jgi:hypothetical protein
MLEAIAWTYIVIQGILILVGLPIIIIGVCLWIGELSDRIACYLKGARHRTVVHIQQRLRGGIGRALR